MDEMDNLDYEKHFDIVAYKHFRKLKKKRVLFLCGNESVQTNVSKLFASRNYFFIALNLKDFDISLLCKNVYSIDSAEFAENIENEAVMEDYAFHNDTDNLYTGFSLLVDIYPEKVDDRQALYIVRLLDDDVKKHVYIYDALIYDDGYVLKKYTNYREKEHINELVFLLRVGVGDIFYDYDFLTDIVEETDKNNFKIVFIILDKTGPATYLHILFPSVRVVVAKNMFDIFENLKIIYRAGIFYKLDITMATYSDELLLKRLCCKNYLEKYLNTLNNYLDNDAKEKIEIIFKDKKVIGVQFFTHTNVSKNWDVQNIKEFIDMCNDSGYQVVNFSPTPYGELFEYDLGRLGILEVSYAMQFVDVFVGIDSFGGHAAALLNKKSITIGLYNNLFQPRRNNIIIDSFPENNLSEGTEFCWRSDLKAATVFDAVKSCLEENRTNGI